MKKVWKALRWLVVVVACVFVIAQFIRPAKTNPVADESLALEAHTQIDSKIAAILDRSCADCHSNKTRWPWYSNVAPVSWFVIDHVNHGRSHLNFSEWGKNDVRRQSDELDQMCELAKAGEMPLSSYTPLHPGSKLAPEDVKAICDWTDQQRMRLGSR